MNDHDDVCRSTDPEQRELEGALRTMLRERAADAVPAPDAWERFMGRVDDGSPHPTLLSRTDLRSANRRRWPALAAAAAAVVALVAGAIAIRDGGDVTQSTASGPDAVADAPADVIPPDPGHEPIGYGGPAVFGVGEGFVDPRAATKAYLTDRLPDAPGLVVGEPVTSHADLVRVRWASFEDGPVGAGPIEGDPVAAGTIFLRNDAGPGGEWVVQASLLDSVTVDALDAFGSSVVVAGTKSTPQAAELAVRPLVAEPPVLEAGNELPDGPFEERRTFDSVGVHVVVIRIVGGTTLGIAEQPVTPLSVAVGPVAPGDTDPADVAAQTVAQVLGRTLTGSPPATLVSPETSDDDRYVVPTAEGDVLASVGPVSGGIGVTALWDEALGETSATVDGAGISVRTTSPGNGTLEVSYSAGGGLLGEQAMQVGPGESGSAVSYSELGVVPGEPVIVFLDLRVDGARYRAVLGVA